jgi:hypothetical protein
MINFNRFFDTAIEAKKFIRKERVWHEFKNQDPKSVGYLTYEKLNLYFSDINKRKNIQIKSGSVADFEKFYQLWTQYETSSK